MMIDPKLSIVVPMFNEEASVNELHRRLSDVLRTIAQPYELIFVDDGSVDKTFEMLKAITAKDERVKVILLRRNFGQTSALAAGFAESRGEIIISMDGDLQHCPEDIPKLLEKMDEGYDLVSGWRKKRRDNFLIRRLPSMIANKMMAILSGISLHDFGTTFKAYRREVIEDLELYGELHRFIPALASQQGIRIAEVPIQNVLRKGGKSKYTLGRTSRVFLDLITVKFLISYIARPLQLFGSVGLVFFGIGFLIALVITLRYYFADLIIQDHLGNLILSMLMMVVGIQLIAIGLSSEVSSRIYHNVTRKKIYTVREKWMRGKKL
jgi:glycosyltransferase involved in cell wall biosynthesis